ncbi:MAG: hypothetical protein PHU59_04860, partial [Candidatus Omnitrophica bacterium]|nr:hypothetical protein [Candidatus Omnitrophota bacterium]
FFHLCLNLFGYKHCLGREAVVDPEDKQGDHNAEDYSGFSYIKNTQTRGAHSYKLIVMIELAESIESA